MASRLIEALSKPCTESVPSDLGCLYENVLLDAADAHAAFEAARGDVAELNRERAGLTLVGAAIKFKDAELLEKLIAAGVDLDTPVKLWDADSMHPLQWAAWHGSLRWCAC